VNLEQTGSQEKKEFLEFLCPVGFSERVAIEPNTADRVGTVHIYYFESLSVTKDASIWKIKSSLTWNYL